MATASNITKAEMQLRVEAFSRRTSFAEQRLVTQTRYVNEMAVEMLQDKGRIDELEAFILCIAEADVTTIDLAELQACAKALSLDIPTTEDQISQHPEHARWVAALPPKV